MHIPSERIDKEMRSEEVSLWVVPANGGDEIAFLVKAPMSAIKALFAGCSMEFLLGRDGSYLCHGVRILDSPDAPLLISGAVTVKEEILAIKRLFQDRQCPLFLFNEMDVCLGWTYLEVSEEDACAINESVRNFESLQAGEFDRNFNHALDCFCYSADPTQFYSEAKEIPVVCMGLDIEPWRANKNHFIGVRESHVIEIDDSNEGDVLERAVWASLESVFPLTLYKSPLVRIGGKVRELTDVLSFHEYGNFLFESKDLSIFGSGYKRNQARRVSGVQKQITKAIRQLVGACKAINRGERVFSQNGVELGVVRDKPSHCIVLVTEIEGPGDWSRVVRELMTAMKDTGSFFHVLDLRELITLLKVSSGRADLLDCNLMERCRHAAKLCSVHIRSCVAPGKNNQADA
jgi:hypothetical protein